MTNASRDILFALALIAMAAGACNPSEDGEPARSLNPVAPSAANAILEATPAGVGAGATIPAPRAMVAPGTCIPGPGYIRCWHFRPTLVLWVSPNATWARGGSPFVSHLRSGFKVHCDKTIVWSGGRRIYRVSPMRPVTIDGTRYTCS